MWENEENWFFPELTREQARTILQGTDTGTFLVRVSGTAEKGPVLSVNGGSQKIIHFTIDLRDGRYAIGSHLFDSLHSILIHYQHNPLTDDGLLKLTAPAEVRFFAKNDWNRSEEQAKKLLSLVAIVSDDSPLTFLPVHCGQHLRLLRRKPISVTNLTGGDEDIMSKLWLMETEDKSVRGLVPSNCLLIFVRSEYDSFMQRQHLANKDGVAATQMIQNIQQPVPPSLPPLLGSVATRPAAITCPFSDRRLLGHQSQDVSQLIPSSSTALVAKTFALDKFEMPSQFPAKAVALLDRTPNFYDRSHLRFRKGDKITVYKPTNTVSHGVEDCLSYGWYEASVDGETNRRGLIPVFSSYIKWL